jgi:hypothetical protein
MLLFYKDAEILLTCAGISMSMCGYCFHCRKCCFVQDHLTQYDYKVKLFHNLLQIVNLCCLLSCVE